MIAPYAAGSMKRRHLAADDFLFDRACPRAHLFVSDQGHGSHPALAMALLASLLEDRRDVFSKPQSWVEKVRRKVV
jgi:hypothetical protein